MSYFCIENVGVCPIQGFDLLGASSARETTRIGQFGTGAKHGVLVLLRLGKRFKIYLGTKCVDFFIQPEMIGDKEVNRICYTFDGKTKETSMSKEFGELDWGTNLNMALREFISNAIDQNDGKACNLSFVERPEGKEGMTRIFVEACKEVKNYWANIENYFLHFSCEDILGKSYFPNKAQEGPTIYRRGVFVKTEERGKHTPSMYNYDFADIKIDECRNLTHYQTSAQIGRLIAENEDMFVSIMQSVINGGTCWEYERVEGYYIEGKDWRNRHIMGEWWAKHFGDLMITGEDTIYAYAQSKKIPCVRIKSDWVQQLSRAGVPIMDKCAPALLKEGFTDSPPTTLLMKNVKRIWNILEEVHVTTGKELPTIKMFDSIQDGQSNTYGIYKSGTVYIHRDHTEDLHTILHELGHHITGSGDCTHDFQEFAFLVASRLIATKKQKRQKV